MAEGITRRSGGGDGTHFHNGDTLQCDGINSDGGAFAFTTTGDISVAAGMNLLCGAGCELGSSTQGWDTVFIEELAASIASPDATTHGLYVLDDGKAVTLQWETSGNDNTVYTDGA